MRRGRGAAGAGVQVRPVPWVNQARAQRRSQRAAVAVVAAVDVAEPLALPERRQAVVAVAVVAVAAAELVLPERVAELPHSPGLAELRADVEVAVEVAAECRRSMFSPADGMLHTLYISNGTDAKPPVRFLPANANASGLTLLDDNMMYAATSGNCGGVPNGIWALDTSAPNAAPEHWSTNGGGVAGTVGPAFGSDGSVYAATGDGDYTPASLSDSVVVLDAKTLKLKDYFTPSKSEFTSSPTVFAYKGRDVVAAANKDGRLYLLDSKELGGADHKTPLAASTQIANGRTLANAGSLASWVRFHPAL